MAYANCPRCWFTVRLAPDAAPPAACPRCLALHEITLPMYRSGAPAARAAAVARRGSVARPTRLAPAAAGREPTVSS